MGRGAKPEDKRQGQEGEVAPESRADALHKENMLTVTDLSKLASVKNMKLPTTISKEGIDLKGPDSE